MPKANLIKEANTDEELDTMIKGLGTEKCCVVFFHLPWCGSCKKIEPFVDSLSHKYSKTLFIKADAEKCTSATKKHRIVTVPLFILYNNKTRVDRVEGASPSELEQKVKRIQGDIDFKNSSKSAIIPTLPGSKLTDIVNYMDKKNCKCINDLSPTGFQGFIDGNKLISGKGIGRLLMIYAFTDKMVLKAFKIKAPSSSGPKVLRFFKNVSKPLDLAIVNQMAATQEITLTEDDLTGEQSIELRSGSFVGVTSLQIYIPENMTKSRRIEIDQLTLLGGPLELTPYGFTDTDAYAGAAAGYSKGSQQKNY